MIDLSGIMTAIVTPLNADRTLNREQLKNLIDFQIKTVFTASSRSAARVNILR